MTNVLDIFIAFISKVRGFCFFLAENVQELHVWKK